MGVVLVFTVLLVLSDLGAGLWYGPCWLPSWQAVLASAGVLGLLSVVLFLGSWAPLAWLGRRLVGWKGTSLAAGVAAFWLVFVRIGHFCGLLNAYLSLMHGVKVLGAVLLGLAFAAAAAYWTERGIRKGTPPIRAWLLGFVFPFVAGEAAACLSWRACWSVLPADRCSLLASVSFVLFWILAWVLAWTRKRKGMGFAVSSMLFLLPLAALGLRSVWEAGKGRSPGASGVEKVVLITVDTLRRDGVSCYSSAAPSTPAMDRLAEEGILFQHCVASSPWTLPSFASLMTGTSPSVHLTVDKGSRLPESLPTLAEYLRDANFFTAGIACNPYLKHPYRLDKGLDQYHDLNNLWTANPLGYKLARALFPERFPLGYSTEQTASLASRWIRRYSDRSFLLWIHFLDPHLPYSPPPEGQEERPPGFSGRPPRYAATLAMSIREGQHVPTEEEKDWARRLYEGEVRNVDKAVGALLDSLDDVDAERDTLTVVTSDHGEEFWEHGGFEHGHTVYGELLHVPLLLRGPGLPAGKEVKTRVSLEGLLPTVLDLCGVPFAPETLSHPSWRPLLEAEDTAWEERPLVSSGTLHGPQRIAVYWGRYKYAAVSSGGNEPEEPMLFDLEADPGEQSPLPEERRDDRVVQGILDVLETHADDGERLRSYYRIQGAESHSLGETLDRELRALGYVK